MVAKWTGCLPIKSRQPTSATYVAGRECDWLPCWLLYSQQVLHRQFMACRWWSMQVRDPSWLWNPGEMSSEVQNRGTSGPTKRTHVLQKFNKKKRFRHIIATGSSVIYCWAFGQWLNIPPASTCLLTCGPIWATGQYACGSRRSIISLAKHPLINFTAFSCNNMSNFFLLPNISW